MQLSAEDRGDYLLIRVEGDRIDAAATIQFKDRMRALTEGGPLRTVLDLSRVSFIDSSGLGAVVAAMKALGSDRKLELACLSPTVLKVFHLTRMDTIFRIHGTLPGGMRDAG